jgi:hypothetical protein
MKQRCDQCEAERQAEKTKNALDLQRTLDRERQEEIPAIEQLRLWQAEAMDHGRFEISETLQELKACLSDSKAYAGIGGLGYLGLDGDWIPLVITTTELTQRCQGATASTTAEVSLTMTEKRTLEERISPLLRPEVMAQRPYQFSPKDSRSMMDHCENKRRGVVEFLTIKEPAEGFRENQLKLRAIKTPADAEAAINERKMAVYASLDDDYLAVRVSIIRQWGQYLVECEGESPWRLHWPASHGDDQIMSNFLWILSLRNTSYKVVEAAKMHVIEFHFAFLSVPPPPFPVAEWTLRKLKLAMAKEKPEGRRVRPALSNDAVAEICSKLHATLIVASPAKQRLYANAGAAIGFIYEKALRAGEACPGTKFTPTKHLSRSTIAGALIPREQLQSRGKVLIIQPPVRKTTHTSVVTAQVTNQPLVFDTQSEASYSFSKWGPLLEEYDACKTSDRSITPAFREGGLGSVALSTTSFKKILCTLAQSVVPNWSIYSYGAQSLRIGRENAWRATNMASAEFLNGLTTHTSTAGRMPYARLQIEEILKVDRAAETVKLAPAETAYKFDADRSGPRPAVYMAQDESGAFTRRLADEVTSQLVDPQDESSDSEDDSFEPPVEEIEAAAPTTNDLAPVKSGRRKRAAADSNTEETVPVTKKPKGRAAIAGMRWNTVKGVWAVSGQPSVLAWT